MKKTHIAAVLCVGLLTGGCVDFHFGSKETIRGSGQISSESREVTDFDRVWIAGSGSVRIVQGDTESLTIEADDNLLGHIRSEVSGRHLKIGPHHGVNLRPSRPIQYRLALKNLRDLELAGSLNAECESIETSELALRISGSGNIVVGSLNAESLSLRISGSGKCTAAGRAPATDIHISGSGDCLAGELAARNADVRISGSGSARLWVTESLEAHISGSGRVEYYGKPLVDQHVSGSGRIRSLGEK